MTAKPNSNDLRPSISIVTPAFNEEVTLPILRQRLTGILEELGESWEWIVVDDHSRDGTFETIRRLAVEDGRIRGLRLSRNCGAHIGLVCGLREARGRCAIVMAADLQDPPEVIPELVEKWRDGAQIVWAARAKRPDEGLMTRVFSRLYHRLARRVSGSETLPATGADFFLIDRVPLDAFCGFDERNISTFMLVNWMGFRQDVVDYVKDVRTHGTSGWSLSKKIKLVVDSVVPFSHTPVRAMSGLGIVTALLGLIYAGWIFINTLFGEPPAGWSSLMVVVLIVGGAQMLMLGVLGEYIWRGAEEARKRPLYTVEATTDATPPASAPARDI